jgi:hypothetical protein
MPVSDVITAISPGMYDVSGIMTALPSWMLHTVWHVLAVHRMKSRAIPNITFPRGSGLAGNSGRYPCVTPYGFMAVQAAAT